MQCSTRTNRNNYNEVNYEVNDDDDEKVDDGHGKVDDEDDTHGAGGELHPPRLLISHVRADQASLPWW